MSPYTLLSNSATVRSDNEIKVAEGGTDAPSSKAKPAPDPSEFHSYVDKLLEQVDRPGSSSLLSPTEDESRSLNHIADPQTCVKELIDMCIIQGNINSSKRNVNRFEINRGGEKVAVIMLSRPSYRLGETIPVVVDFHQADVACYSLHATLESSESVDPTIALRSKASIQRVTRRIHASHHECTISSERVLFNPMIPPLATPEFLTSGVSLEWHLRFEFVTNRFGRTEDFEVDLDGFLEDIAKDDRGTVKAAVQGLSCETFDVAVPLRVYGATAVFDEHTESGSFAI